MTHPEFNIQGVLCFSPLPHFCGTGKGGYLRKNRVPAAQNAAGTLFLRKYPPSLFHRNGEGGSRSGGMGTKKHDTSRILISGCVMFFLSSKIVSFLKAKPVR